MSTISTGKLNGSVARSRLGPLSAVLLAVAVSVVFFSCSGTVEQHLGSRAIHVTFVQLNDIYEIGPLDEGKSGGMARVARLVQGLKKQNPNTYVVVSGDFLSPSVIGTVKHEGRRIAGAQMVDAMNAIGVDYVTFGNHEFDISREELQQRIDESRFSWVSSNVRVIAGNEFRPFARVRGDSVLPFPEQVVLTIDLRTGESFRIGLLGLTLPANRQTWLAYEDVKSAVRRLLPELRRRTDMVVALTHLTIDEDKELAMNFQDLGLILGGHEHEHMYHRIARSIIAKADANARTVYIHDITFDPYNHQIDITSRLQPIDGTIHPDPAVSGLVTRWTNIAGDGLRAQGFDPDERISVLRDELDGREIPMRTTQTNLGALITSAMLDAAPDAAAAICNGGSVRVDDMVRGSVTQWDVIRILPFGGKILTVELKGRLLENILRTGEDNSGSGGYLQRANLANRGGRWYLGAEAIEDDVVYRVAFTDFLLSGKEKNLDYLTKDNPDIVRVVEPDSANQDDTRNDIRRAVVRRLKKLKQ